MGSKALRRLPLPLNRPLGDSQLRKANHRSPRSRSELMASVRRSGTAPELVVRRTLRLLKVPFTTSNTDLPGSPDLSNRTDRWAVFVNGCFWHRHKGCSRTTTPKANKDFWLRKFAENEKRDRRNVSRLRRLGYRVWTVWECETLQTRRLATRLMALPSVRNDLDQTQKRFRYKFNPSRTRVQRLLVSDTGTKRSSVRLSHVPNGQDAAEAFDKALLSNERRPRRSKGPIVRTVDLFSGCGGLSLGALEACQALGLRFSPALALDASKSSLDVYVSNFRPESVANCDIWEVVDGSRGAPLTNAESALRDALGDIDLLLAGPPCQGHSDLNNHTRRNDERNELYERVARFAYVVRPTSILIENVPSVVHDVRETHLKTKRTLESIGYNVDTGIVDLWGLGVPQLRRRHVLVASKARRVDIVSMLQPHEVIGSRTLRFAIGDIAREHRNGPFTRWAKASPENARRLTMLFEKDLLDLPNKARPLCHQDGDHSYTAAYGRLLYDLPAPTITSGFGSPGQGRFIHPTQRRTLTPHEAARVQFFPDWFDFSSVTKRTDLSEMIGNAVPMKLSFALCVELLA